MPTKSEHIRLSLSEGTDLWEHACLLFHNFEWHAAAETFDYLRHLTSDPETQVFCFLNAGLVLARLGNLDSAHSAFDNALRLDMHEPITHFLLGLVEAELGDAVRSLARFEMCLDEMYGRNVDYRDRQLDHVLTLDTVKSNAAVMWKAIQAQHGMSQTRPTPVALERLPGELLFEAPSRSSSAEFSGRATSGSWTPRQPVMPQDVAGRHSRFTAVSHLSVDSHYADPESVRSSRETMNTLKSLILRTATPTPESIADHDARSPPKEPVGLGLSVPARQPVRTFTPRDARVADESMRELSSFIRHAGPATTGKEVVTIDRDYMLRLLQNDVTLAPADETENLSSLPDEEHTGRRAGRDGIDSVLDLYASYSRSLAMEDLAQTPNPPAAVEAVPPSVPHRAPDLIPSGRYSLFPPLRPQAPPSSSLARTNGIVRKPLPSHVTARSVPIIPDINIASTTLATRPTLVAHPGKPYRPSTPDESRPGLSTAERWLRKEVKPPWSRRRGFGHGRAASDVSALSNDGSEGVSTLPSTMSSVEILGFGRGRGAGMGRR